MTKVSARMTAITLRKLGHSYTEIASRINVSKGTLSVWLAGTPYAPNKEMIEKIGRARAASALAKTRIKLSSIKAAAQEALELTGTFSDRDVLMLGLGLYIGEGTKSSVQTSFVNSNPAIITFMMRWFTKGLGLKVSNLRIRLHIYPDCSISDSIDFWSKATGLPKEQFLKPIIDWRKNKKAVKLGKLPFGTAHIRVNSLGDKRFGVHLSRKILAMCDRVLGTDSFAGVV